MKERRTTHRYKLALAIRVRKVSPHPAGEFSAGEVRNISTGGIYFSIGEHFANNEVLEFSLRIPGLTEAGEALVAGRARVLRVVEKASEPSGIAAIIETFHIVQPG